MGTLYIVSTPIGNLSDITLRAIETLKNVDVILAEDTRVTLKLLNHLNIKKKLISCNKLNEQEKTTYVLDLLKENNVALVTDAGTPCISDPGYFIVKAARDNNIKVESIPGVSAVISALSISGLSSDEFTFYGFLPRDKKSIEAKLKEINQSKVKTFILYESPYRILNLLEIIQNIIGNVNICICNDLTKLHEKIYYGILDIVIKELKNNDKFNKGEYVIVVERNKHVEEIEVNIDDLIYEGLRENKNTKDLVKEICEITGKNKNEVYKRILELKAN